MKLVILRETPLFGVNSADANRNIGIIHRLKSEGVNLEVIFIGTDESSLSNELGIVSKLIANPISMPGRLSVLERYILPLFFTGLFARKISLMFKNEKSVIFWIQDSLLSFKVAEKIKKFSDNAIIFLESSEYPDFYKEHKLPFRERVLKDWKLKIYEESLRDRLDGIALMTRALIDEFSHKSKVENILHLPMTVDLQRFSTASSSFCTDTKEKYIAYIGLLGNVKDGIDVLLRAFALIRDDFPGLKLKLAGPWHYDSPKHEKMIVKLRLGDSVEIMGEVKRDEVPWFLLDSELLLLPRPNSRQAQGGFSTKLGEYLATGKPVCATTVGEIPDYLEDGKSVFFAEPGSVDSFASAMRYALSNPEIAAKVGQAGRIVAEKEFNSKVQAKKLKDFFENLIKSKKHD